MELDPLFVKALGFLRSKNKESTEQLRELLDDVISGGGKKTVSSFSGSMKGAKDRNLLREDNKRGQSSPLRKGFTDDHKRETEKRSLDRGKTDTSDSDVAPAKKAKLERPQRKPAPKPVIEDDDDTTEDESDDDSIHDSSNHDNDSSKEDGADTNTGGSTDADDFALELGLACVVCKKMDVSAGNQLIECQECHNLYHQQCHKPAATNADPNDPRLVWYCARCARNMKRMASKKPKSLPSSGRGDSKGFEKSSSEETTLNMFKRSEPKTVSPSGTSNKQPFTGLAGMAANLSGVRPSISSTKPTKPLTIPAGISQRSSSRSSVSSPVTKTVPRALSSPSSSKSSGSSSSKSGNSGKSAPAQRMSTASSAMKRLQMMKKKASKR